MEKIKKILGRGQRAKISPIRNVPVFRYFQIGEFAFFVVCLGASFFLYNCGNFVARAHVANFSSGNMALAIKALEENESLEKKVQKDVKKIELEIKKAPPKLDYHDKASILEKISSIEEKVNTLSENREKIENIVK